MCVVVGPAQFMIGGHDVHYRIRSLPAQIGRPVTNEFTALYKNLEPRLVVAL